MCFNFMFLGAETTSTILSNNLFVVVAGSNDIINTYFNNPIRRLHYDYSSYTDLLIYSASGFVQPNVVEDYDDWSKWISQHGGIGIPAVRSWESWWAEEQENLRCTGLIGQLAEIILFICFFIYQYGIVYHLHVASNDKSIMVYALSWLVIITVMIIFKVLSQLLRKAKERNLVIPNAKQAGSEQGTFEGATVYHDKK
ncbi:hypothetical protein POM88_016389 [Heracleum sosnowskyi]|uniref:Uncharacterized protein n=1 Tax=Heracleum sosnowskyi TaxID=360622 RepID=A0AAD8INR9_9APIA|nr:hypothetical protein POM88_016389 [Heracleum sosnowskyi]